MRKNIGVYRGNVGLYRGKPKYNNDGKILNPDLVKYYDFVYGSLVISGERYFICLDVDIILPNNIFVNNVRASMVEVLPETVGEFTGFNDKYGRDIFEGDIIKIIESGYGDDVHYGKVVFRDGCFVVEYKSYIVIETRFVEKEEFKDGNVNITVTYEYEVIGNVCDNPELLEEGESVERDL